MSHYRDDRSAAQLRIEALEAKLAERDAERDACIAALRARDAEIAELRRGRVQPRAWRGWAAPAAFVAFGIATSFAVVALGPAQREPLVVVPAAQIAAETAHPALTAGVHSSALDVVESSIDRKMREGTATLDELRALEAVCQIQQHPACTDLAAKVVRARAAAGRANRLGI